MSILVSNEILDTLHHELQNADESVQIITAYCKENAIKNLNGMIAPSVRDRKLMVRFRLDDVVKGSTDLSAIEYCLSEGWKVYFRFDLHVKTYIVDCKRGIIGSANATNSGLSLSQKPNLEMATVINMEPEDIEKIDKLYKCAIFVDDDLIECMKKEIPDTHSFDIKKPLSWSEQITDRFTPVIETLFSYELPDTDCLVGYVPFLDKEFADNIESYKAAFRWSNAYLWLLQTVKNHQGEIYFGELSAILHSTLISDPKPYRKDVKALLSNLLSLVDKLDMKELIIDRPSHSQRIRSAK